MGVTLRKALHGARCALAGTYCGPYVPETRYGACFCAYESGITTERFVVEIGCMTPSDDFYADSVTMLEPSGTVSLIDAVAEFAKLVRTTVSNELHYTIREQLFIESMLDEIGDLPLELFVVGGRVEIILRHRLGDKIHYRLTRVV